MMVFHWSYENSPLLFPGWVFNSPGAYALTLMICFAISMFSEWWSTYRHSLNTRVSDNNTIFIKRDDHFSIKELYNKFLDSHLWKTIVHMVAFTINYMVMFFVMSFNGGIAISVILGIGTGYFLFAKKRYVAVVDDLCH
ncbi:hypothetical protein DICPUDRAFT_81308 [Dictyostelium purpureum]|uniref:Copper transport protein n=1 Tax=Dictyostelium purpureum TaxID=5786 RepID=F0ZT37_DICPU|nr:uncharacterized protein DICPUDRAFT_81308 [Dictyostelium purpureum]EGC32900.1 hypothetical protein DICPUDRAFT_81308 [Dictyostelium purpureum]|eukprot:XP_003290585.1 hypothetical protein DICPUDRAFT_81308 [Dictyostelium purpureum]